MPKCIHLTKYFRSQKNVNIIHYNNYYNNNYYSNTVCLRRHASGQGGGGGRPARNSGRPPTLPPYPAGLVIGVCGRKRPGRMVFVISQIHIDEIAAVANAVFYADPELQEELKEKRPYLFYEELENDFRELKAWTVTERVGWFEKHGVKRLRKTKSYCYVLTPQWLEANLSYKTASTFCYIDESSEANSLLEKARAERFVPLFHWQSRNHIDVEPRVKANSLADGYLLDNRKWCSYAPNVVPKCVPSILDVAKNPRQHRGNPFAKLALSGRIHP